MALAILLACTAAASPPGFSRAPRHAEARASLPKALQPLVPAHGIYAAGGGLTSGAWRVVVTLDGDLRAGSDTKHGASSIMLADTKHAKLDAAAVADLVTLADRAWREERKANLHPTADYDELLIVADGDDVFELEGYGPIRGGAAEELVGRLHALLP
jgi:hypothetical protein